MIKTQKLLNFSILILLFILKGNICADVKNFNNRSKVFLDNSVLEKAGFYHIDSLDFRMLRKGEFVYILNYLDKVVARFKYGKPERVYSASGQGPGEFIYPRSIFIYDNETIAVFDTGRIRVFFFDLDLNYKREVKVDSNIRKVNKFGKKILAFGDFDKNSLAILDNNFKKIETFSEIPIKLPFKRIFRQFLYMGYFIDDCDIASTSWLYLRPNCKMDIIDLKSKKVKLSLTWKHPCPPTQKSIDTKKNYYGSYYMGKHGEYYLIQNALSKKLLGEKILETLIFNKNGDLLYKWEFPYFFIATYPNDSKVFFVDEDENIRHLDIKNLINE